MTKYVTGAQVRGHVSSRTIKETAASQMYIRCCAFVHIYELVKLNLDLRLHCDLIKEGRSPFPPDKNDHKRPVYN